MSSRFYSADMGELIDPLAAAIRTHFSNMAGNGRARRKGKSEKYRRQ